MTIDQVVTDFMASAVQNEWILPEDRIYLTNRLLELLDKKDYDLFLPASKNREEPLVLLDRLVEFAVNTKVIEDLTAERDILSAKIMDLFTPLPSVINHRFWTLYEDQPKKATDYFYRLSTMNDYVKTRDIARNIEFTYDSTYGPLEITINLSKPEKDPKQIALARKQQTTTSYPACALCIQNEGYAGHLNHAPRTNHRVIRMQLNNEVWGFQYSPYAYYNEHAIFLSEEHRPMNVDKVALGNLLDIVTQFPHYFVGSNAGLPIVGGSILSHDHYQGGRYEFPMAKMDVERTFTIDRYPEVSAGIVKWPMSVIRLRSSDKKQLLDAAGYVMDSWADYTDEEAMVYAYTDGEPHNAVTPIARRRGDEYELDMVLRNNLTTEEFPDGLYHPHPDVQHIKKENIGLIEVMGLAILPPRLETELKEVERFLLDEPADVAEYHQPWADRLKKTQTPITKENVRGIIQEGVGAVFQRVLEDAGVYKRTEEGKAAFWRFVETLGIQKESENKHVSIK